MRSHPSLSFRQVKALFIAFILSLLTFLAYFGLKPQDLSVELRTAERNQQAWATHLRNSIDVPHSSIARATPRAQNGPINATRHALQHHVYDSSGDFRKRKRAFDPNKNTNLATGATISKIKGMSINDSICLRNLMDSKGPWTKALIAAAQRLNRRGSIVLTGGDWNYRGVLMNWMAMMDRLNIAEYLVFCYDERLLNIVGPWESGGHGILTPNCTSIQEFMYLKLVGVNALIHAGYSATWSDCDCVWLRPFLDQWILPYGSEYDVIGQRALHPRGISNKTGAVLCTGLFTVFPTERSIMLFERIIKLLPDYSHVISDQSVLNEVLDSVGAYAVTEKFVYQDDSVVLTPSRPLHAASPRLGLLPFHVFPRPASSKQYLAIAKSRRWGESLSVCHIRISKIASEKLLEMYNSYVLAISMNWAAVESRATFLQVVDYSGVRQPPLPRITSPRLAVEPLPNLTIPSDVSARIDSELRRNLEKILRAKNRTVGYQGANPLRNV